MNAHMILIKNFLDNRRLPRAAPVGWWPRSFNSLQCSIKSEIQILNVALLAALSFDARVWRAFSVCMVPFLWNSRGDCLPLRSSSSPPQLVLNYSSNFWHLSVIVCQGEGRSPRTRTSSIYNCRSIAIDALAFGERFPSNFILNLSIGEKSNLRQVPLFQISNSVERVERRSMNVQQSLNKRLPGSRGTPFLSASFSLECIICYSTFFRIMSFLQRVLCKVCTSSTDSVLQSL